MLIHRQCATLLQDVKVALCVAVCGCVSVKLFSYGNNTARDMAESSH